jgi:hypothetical protein
MNLKSLLSDPDQYDKTKVCDLLNDHYKNLSHPHTFTIYNTFSGKFQLTLDGAKACDGIVPAFKIKLDNNFIKSGAFILSSNRVFNMPWGVMNKMFIFWNDTINFELAMCDYDLKQYFKFKK